MFWALLNLPVSTLALGLQPTAPLGSTMAVNSLKPPCLLDLPLGRGHLLTGLQDPNPSFMHGWHSFFYCLFSTNTVQLPLQASLGPCWLQPPLLRSDLILDQRTDSGKSQTGNTKDLPLEQPTAIGTRQMIGGRPASIHFIISNHFQVS